MTDQDQHRPLSALPQRVSKGAAAERQLITAIRLFFTNGDAVSVHTLAGAASEIIDTLCRKRGIDPFSAWVLRNRSVMDEKNYFAAKNYYRNFFKHAERDHDSVLEGFKDDANDDILYIASLDLMTLNGHGPPEAQVMDLWFKSAHRTRFGEQTISNIDTFFPNLHTMPRFLQKLAGRSLIEWCHSEPAVFEPLVRDRSESKEG
jgi:hypothetical protein